MNQTTNYSLNKPTENSNGWADPINSNFDTIDQILKANADNISTHAHSADQIASQGPANNVQDALDNLNTTKANANHAHTDYAVPIASLQSRVTSIEEDLSTINNTLDLLVPNLDGVSISASIVNRPGGIRINVSSQPVIRISYIGIVVIFEGSIIFDALSSSSSFFIHENALNIGNNTTVQIKILVFSGETSKSAIYSHTFQHVNSDFENMVIDYMQLLTIPNILNALAQDDDSLQAIANKLHSSNTLAYKIAFLQGQLNN